MNRLVLIVPGLLGSESVLRNGPWSNSFESQGLCRKVRMPQSETDWLASCLGLNPERHTLAAGPLAIAAWNWEPPLDATLFRLSLLGLDDEERLIAASVPSADERAWLASQMPRLGGGKWTVVAGAGLEWGLVWENGSLDLNTSPPEQALGDPLSMHLPEGDGERRLRQLIEDSRHLFAESEWNRRRRGEGLPEISVAWPWGHGFRPILPNIPLSIASPLAFCAEGLSAQGLARLVRAQHVDSPNIWKSELAWPVGYPASVMVLTGLRAAREHGQTDKVEWAWSKMVHQLLEPMMRLAGNQRTRILVVGDGMGVEGLAMLWDSHRREGDGVPFDERALDESRLAIGEFWECVRNFLSAPL